MEKRPSAHADTRVAVRHHVPGRTRLAVQPWPDDAALRRLAASFPAHGGAVAAANGRTGSILLRHGSRLAPGDVQKLVAAALSGEDGGGTGLPAAGKGAAARLAAVAAAEVPDVFARLASSPAGLGPDEAARRLAAVGPNAEPPAHGRSTAEIAVAQLATVPVGLLLASAAVSFATGGLLDAAVTAAWSSSTPPSASRPSVRRSG